MDTETLIAQLSSEAAPTRARTSPWRMAAGWLVGLSAYVAIAVVATAPRADLLAQLQTPLFALEVFLLIALAASCAISAALLSFPDMYQARRAAQMPLVLFSLFAVVVGYSLMGQPAEFDFALAHCECTLFITFYALLPAALLFHAMRKGASTNSAAAASVAVFMAFSIGAIILRFVEQTDSMPHVVTYHYVPMLAAALLGPALGRKLLRW